MNENMEAEKFAKELDSLLAGKKGGEALDAELAKDMEFAEKLVCSDKSGESQVRRSLKEKLLKVAAPEPRGWLSMPAFSPRLAALCACLAVAILSPLALFMAWKDTPRYAPHGKSGFTAAKLEAFSFARGASNSGRRLLASGSAAGSSLGYVQSAPTSIPFDTNQGPGQVLSGGGQGAAWNEPPISASNVPNKAGSSNSLRAVSRAPSYMGLGTRGSKGSRASSLEDLKRMAERAGSVMNRQGSAGSNLETAAGIGGMAAGDGMGGAGQGRSGKDSKVLGESLAFLAAKENASRAMNVPYEPTAEREGYKSLVEGEFLKASAHPLSTFSIDVDVASYGNMRRFLKQDRLPPPESVRIEEFINYFQYDLPEPQHGQPIAIVADVAENPWHAKYKLVRVAVKGKTISKAELPPSNLVFLIDSSGSMQDANKLSLVQKALRLLVDELRPQDRVSIVTYASSAKVVLGATSGGRKAEILAAIDKLRADGSTAGADGLQLAYRVAERSLAAKGNNRVILATDGDFNVGVSDDAGIVRLIEGERNKGVFLTVLGVGQGNYQDAKMQQLADKGNGNYAYLDDIEEAHKVLVAQLSGTLQAVAKDVKIQVEFNPARVQAYRLIGYEKRALQTEDFRNDKADAGELGAGHTVTALYEVIPVGVATDLPAVDSLRYQKPDASQELLAVKVRFKDPNGTQSRLLVQPLVDEFRPWSQASPDFKFATSAAAFGMLLRGSVYAKDLTYAKVYRMAQASGGKDPDGTRGEFLRLVEKARLLKGPDAR